MTIRNKKETRQKIIDSVGYIIEKKGFQNLGVNAISRQAGCDKVLIYRYFGGIDGLLEEYFKQHDFYGNIQDFIDIPWSQLNYNKIRELSKRILIEQLRKTLKDEKLQEVMRWELIENNEALRKNLEQREEIGNKIMQSFKKVIGEVSIDMEAVIALLAGGLYYIVLIQKNSLVFNGLDLSKDQTWLRIERTVETIIDLIFEHKINSGNNANVNTKWKS